ncbi:MAG TPA: hypothetical protein VIG72_02045 [Pontibacter sp.]
MNAITDFIEFRIDSHKKLLYCRWLRDVNTTEYKAGLDRVHHLLVTHNIQLWLQDSTPLQPRTADVLRWTTEEFGLLLIQSPLKQLAVVAPPTSPHFAVLRSLREKAYRIFGRTKQLELFETHEEALRWLTPNLPHYRLPSLPVPENN